MSQADRATLEALCSALRGQIPQEPDWDAILTLANRTLVTPALAHSLDGRPEVPEEVLDFLQHISQRTRARNAVMRGQLQDACDALVRAGHRPILIKGACFLADPDHQLGQRLFADIDLLLPFEISDAVIAALGSVGYETYPSSVSHKDGYNLSREVDAGGLDLHFRLRALPRAPRYADMLPFTTPTKIGGSEVLTLTPTAQAAVLIAHDQIQERDYWRGLIDLRHLLDLDTITARHGPLDAGALDRLFPTSSSRRALETQLLTAHRLFGTPLPEGFRPTRRARLQAKRREWQLARPSAMRLLTAASMLADLPALASPVSALPGWRLRARYLRRMFEPRKDTKA